MAAVSFLRFIFGVNFIVLTFVFGYVMYDKEFEPKENIIQAIRKTVSVQVNFDITLVSTSNAHSL